ncbi:hypothetical protein HJ144_02960 [Vibrio parahaemolyticus]|nr:hypothetical protein [Vibrio parahaemolyticus]
MLLWNLSSLVVFSLILMFLGISIFELIAELGWFSIIIAVLTLITVCLAYFIFKSGEKMAIKVLLKEQKGA